MPDTKPKIQFRSKESDENLTLEEFADQSRDFYSALSGLDQFISPHGKIAVAFRVIGLEDSLEDNSAKVVPMFLSTIQDLNAGKGFETLPRQVLEPCTGSPAP